EFAFAAFWLYKRSDRWYALEDIDWERQCSETAEAVRHTGENVTLRGVYSSVGLNAHADMIIWAVSPQVEKLQEYAVAFDKTRLGRRMAMVECYVGVGGMSLYDPTHGPAFLKGEDAKAYLSVYPFTKTPDWYLVPFEERRRLMIEHGELGREFPTILTNTVNSFGIQDQEFIVALEDDDPHELIRMVQRLRAAEVRKYTAVDTPIYLGRRKKIEDVLEDLR
ncbi:MAG: chlorite dismutase family protein, partial [Chloroflexota bacterium]|nr:chlorite dismutase family protein [Chloroflexota bacterium]